MSSKYAPYIPDDSEYETDEETDVESVDDSDVDADTDADDAREADDEAAHNENESDDDDDDDDDESEEDEDDAEFYKKRIQRDPRYALVSAPIGGLKEEFVGVVGGRGGFNDMDDAGIDNRLQAAQYVADNNFTAQSSQLYLNPTTQTKSSLYSFISEYRDESVYPTSSYFQLKLPRVYRNVSQVQIVQINFPNYQNIVNSQFETAIETIIVQTGGNLDDCSNVFLGDERTSFLFSEANRPLFGRGTERKFFTTVRPGSYSTASLVDELNLQMSQTPPFSMMSFDRFAEIAAVPTDVHLLFNEGGDSFYSHIGSSFISSHTKNDIVREFYPDFPNFRDAGIFDYQEKFVAYYYPVFRFALLMPRYEQYMDFLDYTRDDIYCRVVQSFEGFDSSFYYDLCNANRVYLERIRRTHTFEFNGINRYEWFYDSKVNRVGVKFDTLHTSLMNDLKLNYNTRLNEAVSTYGYNTNTFLGLKQSHAQSAQTMNGLWQIHSELLSKNLGVPYGSFPLSDMICGNRGCVCDESNYVMYTQPADSVYKFQTIRQSDASVASVEDFSQTSVSGDIVRRWGGMTGLSSATFDISDVVHSSREFSYSSVANNFLIEADKRFTDSSGFLDVEYGHNGGSVTTVVNVPAGKYGIVRFRNPVAQNVQLMTMPVPFVHNVDHGEQFSYNGSLLLNKGYTHDETVVGSDNVLGGGSGSILNISMGSTIYTSSGDAFTNVPFNTVYSNNIISPVKYFKIGGVPFIDSGSLSLLAVGRRYKMTLVCEIVGGGGSSGKSLDLFVYNSRDWLMADASGTEAHYLTTMRTSATGTVSFFAYSGADYYIKVRATDTSVVVPCQYKFCLYYSNSVPVINTTEDLNVIDVAEHLSDIHSLQSDSDNEGVGHMDGSYLNYRIASLYDTNYSSAMSAQWRGDSSIGPFRESFNNPSTLTADTWLGYERNGSGSGSGSTRSNDITDYKGWQEGSVASSAGDVFRKDPLNGYTAKKVDDEGSIQIYDTNYNPYTLEVNGGAGSGSDVTYHEYKQVHWHNTHYLPPNTMDGLAPAAFSANPVVTASTIQPFSSSGGGGSGGVLVNGYNYYNMSGLYPELADPCIQLGNGVCGMAVQLPDGIYSLRRFTFKSAYCGPISTDPNSRITKFRLYPNSSVLRKSVADIANYSHIAELVFDNYITYDNPSDTASADQSMGRWWNFKLGSESGSDALPIFGHTLQSKEVTLNEHDIYSLIAFDSNDMPVNISMLCGSLVPNPDASEPLSSPMYADGVSVSPTGEDVIVPTNVDISGKPWIHNVYASQYEASLPIKTTALHYKTNVPFYYDSSGIVPYSRDILNHHSRNIIASFFYNIAGVSYHCYKDVGVDYIDVYSVDSVTKEETYVSTTDLNAFTPLGETCLDFTTNDDTGYILTEHSGAGEFRLYVVYGISFGGSLGPYVDAIDNSVLGMSYNSVTGRFFVNNISGGPVKWGVGSSDSSNTNYITVIRSVTFAPSTVYSSVIPFGDFIDLWANPARNNILFLENGSGSGGSGDYILYSISIDDGSILKTTHLFDKYLGNAGIYSVRQSANGQIYMIGASDAARIMVLVSEKESDIVPSGEFIGYVVPSAFSVSSYIHDFTCGGDNSIWLMDNDTNNLFSNGSASTSIGIQNAWQIFYPTVKLTYKKLANYATPMADVTSAALSYWSGVGTSDISSILADGLLAQPYSTNMFVYKSWTDLVADLNPSPGVWNWGAEQKFIYADVSFRGLYGHSYIPNARLEDSSGDGSSMDDWTYVAIRGYTPNEDFQCLLRAQAPNKYSYGFKTLCDISDEVAAAMNVVGYEEGQFHPDYLRVLRNMNDGAVFNDYTLRGGNYSLDTSGYNEFLSVFYDEGSIFSQKENTMNGIYGLASTNYQSDVQQKYVNVFPPNLLQLGMPPNGASLTTTFLFGDGAVVPTTAFDPCTDISGTDASENLFLCCEALKKFINVQQACLPAGYTAALYAKIGAQGLPITAGNYLIFSYLNPMNNGDLYLQLNTAQSMNTIDVGGHEDRSITQDTTGQTKFFMAKILLSNLGSGQVSQTVIQNPIRFDPPLEKLDHFEFRILTEDFVPLEALYPFTDPNTEWDALLQIDEQISELDRNGDGYFSRVPTITWGDSVKPPY
jgi:hypothetical protein